MVVWMSDVLYVMPDLVLLLFHFQFLLSVPHWQRQERFFFTDKLSIPTFNTLAINYFAVTFFSLISLWILLLCDLCLFYVIVFIWLVWFSYSLYVCHNCRNHVLLIAFVAVNNIYKRVSAHFMLQYWLSLLYTVCCFNLLQACTSSFSFVYI